ncbi:ABC transporter ATP-binding protein [Streptomyces zagrosensis]|uniref:Oligopeptide/dipeptide ABC transporter ATP-binding protein n=1 Tax=Streptomyces zagrosensis TaxID=1042984 RepID=A0A7W9V0W7_9ACTN|nr:ABC transporter ATP-binding protein [Streptomyces zagrosensis]MBB5938580.1 oligopeptide/dipeptide ABC transporter ATP-binding protein [Streptomyces zagrosensis]
MLELENLSVTYRRRRQAPFEALNNVHLRLEAGETLGLVGESGSGKTTMGRAPFGLVPITSGTVRLDGEDVTHATAKERTRLTARMQMVFQDPYGSLNPVRTIQDTMVEPLLVHEPGTSAAQRAQRVAEALDRVGLPRRAAQRLPREFSGGQRQRIAIARALMLKPRLLVCDEPVSALDLSVQAQILNLLADLRAELQISYLFISHDLAVVRHIADRVMVLYRGHVVEEGDAAAMAARPGHPYTHALLSAAPVPDPRTQRTRRQQRQERLTAPLPTTTGGCVFAPRCPHVIDACDTPPRLTPFRTGGLAACHRMEDLRLDPPPGTAAADHPAS